MTGVDPSRGQRPTMSRRWWWWLSAGDTVRPSIQGSRKSIAPISTGGLSPSTVGLNQCDGQDGASEDLCGGYDLRGAVAVSTWLLTFN